RQQHVGGHSIKRAALNTDIIQDVFEALVQRHESLRTTFYVNEEGVPFQQVSETIGFSTEFLTVEGDATYQEQKTETLLAQEVKQSFDLNNGPLLRAKLIALPELAANDCHEHVLIIGMHHIISDGLSVAILMREIAMLYWAFNSNMASPLPPLEIQYPDFSIWQRQYLEGEGLEKQLGYWERKLSNAPMLSTFPSDMTRPPVQTSNGATHRVEFPEGFGRRLSDFANQQGVTPFILLLSAWKMLLSRYSQQDDLCIGIPTSGRGQPVLEPVIGFFVNSMVMRTDISENPTVADVLERVKQTVLDGLDNDDIPIEMAVERLKLSRNPSYTPLVQVAFQLMADTRSQTDSEAAPAQAGDVTVEALKKESVSAKFDITLSMTHSDQLVRGDLEYNTDLYKPDTIKRISEQFKQLAEYLLVGNLSIPLNTLPLVSDDTLAEEVLGEEAVNYQSVLPLTAMQSDMFMDNLVNPTSFQSSHGWQIHIRRPLDVALWQSCLQALSDHSAILRAKFVATEAPYLDMGYLAIAKEKNIHWEFIDHSDNAVSEKELNEWITKTIYRPYDIQNDELISYYLVKLKDDHFVAITAVHHAILDGAGLNSLWVQTTDRYTAIKNGEEYQFTDDNVADFVAENRESFDTQEHRSFWREQLASVEPLDYTVPAPIPEPEHFVTRESYLDADHWAAVKKYCRKQRITPALYFKCLFGLVIDNYCRPDEDFSIQETMGGRTSATANTLGCCIQEIPFVFKRDVLHSNKTFADVLVSARAYQKGIKNHRKISIGVQADISPKGRVGFMYNFYQFLAHTEFLGQTFNPEGTPSDPANNVQFVVTEVAGDLKLNLFFHQHLFSDFAMLQRIAALSEQVVDEQVEQLNDLQYVTDQAEQTLLLATWNDTQKPFDLSLCLHQRFEQQVLLTPDKIAAVDDNITLTYRQLNQKTNQLANYLVEKGVAKNDLVGLCADRSVEFLVGILGILKAGGAYVPMDPKYPQDRLTYMQENSAVTVLLSQKHLAEKVVAAKTAHVFYLDADWHSIEQYSTENLTVAVTPTDRAYMIYTSGSTGLPKGAIIRHDGAVNHIEAERVDLAFPEAFSFLQTAPSSSDISVWQFLGPVICGGKTVVLDDVTNAKKLFDLVKQHELDVVELVPVALQLLMDHVRGLPETERGLPLLRWMMATGEAVSVDLVNDWLALYPNIPVVNAYGPTEAADDVIQCNIKVPIEAGQRSVPIGKPLANLNVFVVDDQLRLVPAGIPGEICISGIGVGEGYWQNPEKTQEAFVVNPFEGMHCEVVGSTHATMYRTGDLGRWLADGSIEYLDRVDNQVKIRGFRIELGEVEAAVAGAQGVREGAVIVKQDMPGGAALVAFIIAADKNDFSIASVRAELRGKLPDFMVPAAIELLDQLPTTPAGKVDKKALEKRVISVTDDGEYCPPETIEEEKVAQIWQEVMGREKISVQSNFFDLGGHSLLATKIVSRASQVFEVHLTVRALFEFPTVQELAANIVGLLAGGEKKDVITTLSRDAIASKEIRVPLSFAQQRLWLLDKIDEGSTAYNVPMAMRIKGGLDVVKLESTLMMLMQRHEGLRTVFREDEEGAYQWVMDVDEFSLIQSTVNSESGIRNAVANEILQPFDLGDGPLIRASLISVGDEGANDYVLVIVAHHIVTDGWSMNILGQELA
ncbi:MAG: amino acid adenylation domain-containing protein, partial [Pseudomonadales bacterium]|nr:amino acid adenylation domain-containing protein [Pseudomonadales bacterium]